MYVGGIGDLSGGKLKKRLKKGLKKVAKIAAVGTAVYFAPTMAAAAAKAAQQKKQQKAQARQQVEAQRQVDAQQAALFMPESARFTPAPQSVAPAFSRSAFAPGYADRTPAFAQDVQQFEPVTITSARTNWLPWAIGGAAILVGGLLLARRR